MLERHSTQYGIQACLWSWSILAAPGDIWFTLIYWYRHLYSQIRWLGSLSRALPIHQGVRQGALLSPLLYAIYINDLLIELEMSNLGVHIHSINCGSPTYANDMALVASSGQNLQSMLHITSNYAYRWHYSFNSWKSIFGESHSSRKVLCSSRIWNMNGFSIPETDSICHLGITISISGSSLNHTLRIIASARSAFYSLQSAGPRFGCFHPTTALKVFNAVPLAILRYGLEVVFPTNSEVLMLERCQLALLKSIMGLPTRCPNIAVHYLLGTIPMRLQIIRAHLSFLLRILALPDSATAREILLALPQIVIPIA